MCRANNDMILCLPQWNTKHESKYTTHGNVPQDVIQSIANLIVRLNWFYFYPAAGFLLLLPQSIVISFNQSRPCARICP